MDSLRCPSCFKRFPSPRELQAHVLGFCGRTQDSAPPAPRIAASAPRGSAAQRVEVASLLTALQAPPNGWILMNKAQTAPILWDGLEQRIVLEWSRTELRLAFFGAGHVSFGQADLRPGGLIRCQGLRWGTQAYTIELRPDQGVTKLVYRWKRVGVAELAQAAFIPAGTRASNEALYSWVRADHPARHPSGPGVAAAAVGAGLGLPGGGGGDSVDPSYSGLGLGPRSGCRKTGAGVNTPGEAGDVAGGGPDPPGGGDPLPGADPDGLALDSDAGGSHYLPESGAVAFGAAGAGAGGGTYHPGDGALASVDDGGLGGSGHLGSAVGGVVGSRSSPTGAAGAGAGAGPDPPGVSDACSDGLGMGGIRSPLAGGGDVPCRAPDSLPGASSAAAGGGDPPPRADDRTVGEGNPPDDDTVFSGSGHSAAKRPQRAPKQLPPRSEEYPIPPGHETSIPPYTQGTNLADFLGCTPEDLLAFLKQCVDSMSTAFDSPEQVGGLSALLERPRSESLIAALGHNPAGQTISFADVAQSLPVLRKLPSSLPSFPLATGADFKFSGMDLSLTLRHLAGVSDLQHSPPGSLKHSISFSFLRAGCPYVLILYLDDKPHKSATASQEVCRLTVTLANLSPASHKFPESWPELGYIVPKEAYRQRLRLGPKKVYSAWLTIVRARAIALAHGILYCILTRPPPRVSLVGPPVTVPAINARVLPPSGGFDVPGVVRADPDETDEDPDAADAVDVKESLAEVRALTDLLSRWPGDSLRGQALPGAGVLEAQAGPAAPGGGMTTIRADNLIPIADGAFSPYIYIFCDRCMEYRITMDLSCSCCGAAPNAPSGVLGSRSPFGRVPTTLGRLLDLRWIQLPPDEMHDWFKVHKRNVYSMTKSLLKDKLLDGVVDRLDSSAACQGLHVSTLLRRAGTREGRIVFPARMSDLAHLHTHLTVSSRHSGDPVAYNFFVGCTAKWSVGHIVTSHPSRYDYAVRMCAAAFEEVEAHPEKVQALWRGMKHTSGDDGTSDDASDIDLDDVAEAEAALEAYRAACIEGSYAVKIDFPSARGAGRSEDAGASSGDDNASSDDPEPSRRRTSTSAPEAGLGAARRRAGAGSPAAGAGAAAPQAASSQFRARGRPPLPPSRARTTPGPSPARAGPASASASADPRAQLSAPGGRGSVPTVVLGDGRSRPPSYIGLHATMYEFRSCTLFGLPSVTSLSHGERGFTLSAQGISTTGGQHAARVGYGYAKGALRLRLRILPPLSALSTSSGEISLLVVPPLLAPRLEDPPEEPRVHPHVNGRRLTMAAAIRAVQSAPPAPLPAFLRAGSATRGGDRPLGGEIIFPKPLLILAEQGTSLPGPSPASAAGAACARGTAGAGAGGLGQLGPPASSALSGGLGDPGPGGLGDSGRGCSSADWASAASARRDPSLSPGTAAPARSRIGACSAAGASAPARCNPLAGVGAAADLLGEPPSCLDDGGASAGRACASPAAGAAARSRLSPLGASTTASPGTEHAIRAAVPAPDPSRGRPSFFTRRPADVRPRPASAEPAGARRVSSGQPTPSASAGGLRRSASASGPLVRLPSGALGRASKARTVRWNGVECVRTFEVEAPNGPGPLSEFCWRRSESLTRFSEQEAAFSVLSHPLMSTAIPLKSVRWHPGYRLRIGKQLQGLDLPALRKHLRLPLAWIVAGVAFRVRGLYTRPRLPNNYVEVHLDILKQVRHCSEVVVASAKYERATMWQVNVLLNSGFLIWTPIPNVPPLILNNLDGGLGDLRRAGGIVASSELMQVWGRRVWGPSPELPEHRVLPASGDVFSEQGSAAPKAALWTPARTPPPPSWRTTLWKIGKIDFTRTTSYYVQSPTCDRRHTLKVASPLPEFENVVYKGVSPLRSWLVSDWAGRDIVGENQLLWSLDVDYWLIVASPWETTPRLVAAYELPRTGLTKIHYIKALPGEDQTRSIQAAISQLSVNGSLKLHWEIPKEHLAELKTAGFAADPDPDDERWLWLTHGAASARGSASRSGLG